MHLRNWRSQRLQIWCNGWMCKSQPTDDKLSLIGAWSGHVTHYKILGLQSYHWNGWTYSRQILYTSRQYRFHATGWHITNIRAWLWSRDCFTILPLVVMHRNVSLSYLCALNLNCCEWKTLNTKSLNFVTFCDFCVILRKLLLLACVILLKLHRIIRWQSLVWSVCCVGDKFTCRKLSAVEEPQYFFTCSWLLTWKWLTVAFC